RKDDAAAAKGNAAMKVEPASVGEEDDEARLGEDLGEGAEEREVPEGAALLAGDLVVGGLEAPDLLGLGRETLHGLHPADALGEKEHHAVGEFAIAEVLGPQARRVVIGEGGQGDRDAEAGAGQPGVDAP